MSDSPDLPSPHGEAAERRLLDRTWTAAEVRRLVEEEVTLREIAALVARAGPADEVFTAVTAAASRLLDGEAVTLTRFTAPRELLVLATAGGPVAPGTRIAYQPGTLPDRIRRHARSDRVDDYEGELDLGLARRFGMTAAVGVAVLVENEVWGMFTATSQTEPLPAGTERRLGEFAELVSSAIANTEWRARLTASRTRIIAAADDARRRLQRDVHDGAQQRLVHAIVALKLARDAGSGAEATSGLIAEALAHAEAANRELRDIVRGILPASLTRGGLAAGVASFVADVPTAIALDISVPRLPQHLETTAYFIVAEAVTNAIKHAQASRIEVVARPWRDGRRLRVVVRDDGLGGADPRHGSGLTGLQDRVEASDGTLTIWSPPGRGTTLTATLPVPGAPAAEAPSDAPRSR